MPQSREPIAPQQRQSMGVVNARDEELIEACLSGRTEAFNQLVLRYQDRLFNALVRSVGSAEDARDAAQDAFVHAYQKLGTFRGNSAFYSWLFRIAMNAAISRRRTRGQGAVSRDGSGLEDVLDPVDPRSDNRPSHRMEMTEQQSQVHEALNSLPEEYRTVLVLKEIEGLKYEEIAEVVDCPVGTVRSRIHRARAELRGKLQLVLRQG